MIKLKPLTGIPIAVAAKWGLASLATFILIRSGHWRFIGDETMPILLSLQVLAFYVACFGANLPSVVAAGFIIGNTDVRRPYLTTFAVVFLFQGLMFAFRLLRWPWVAMPALPSAVPVGAEIVSTLLLTGSAAVGVWWPEFWNRYLLRKKSHS